MPEQKEEVKQQQETNAVPKVYQYLTFVFLGVILLFMLSKSKPKISIEWLLLIAGGFVIYFLFQYYKKRIDQPNYAQMVKIVKNYEVKRGGPYFDLDDSPHNTLCEPLGFDFFGIRFIDEGYTYIIYKNVVVGRSAKDLYELQMDNERYTVLRELARRGVTEVAEI